MIFYNTSDGMLIDENKLRDAYFFLFGESAGDAELEHFSHICKGITGSIKDPSVDYLLNKGEKIAAIKVYRDTHDCSIHEAKSHIESLMSFIS